MRGISIAAVVVGLASGCYNPGVADCLYQCNSGSCPSGLTCVGNMCTSGADCTGSGDGGGGRDATVDSDNDHAACGDHLTYAMGELCFHDSVSVQDFDATAGQAAPQFADWDGDKIADIVMITEKHVRYWRGEGDGTWDGYQEMPLDDLFQRFVADDLNVDGYDDFVFAGPLSYEIYRGTPASEAQYVATATTTGDVVGMSAGRYMDTAANQPEHSVAIANMQIVRVVPLDNTLFPLIAHTFTVMTPDRIYGVATSLSAPLKHVIIGRKDTVSTLDASPPILSVTDSWAGFTAPLGFNAGDFDGDGVTDSVEVDAGGNITVTLGKIVSGQHPRLSTTIIGIKTGIAVGNFDGDAFQDFALVRPVSAAESDVYVFRGASDLSQLVAAEPKPKGGGAFGDWISAGDFNGDTIDDLILMTQNTGTVNVVLSNP
ncbi:hypothetical protein BH11MYX2_BH11MYX2_17020 [soil metagenome]